jgi:hypothetical protein
MASFFGENYALTQTEPRQTITGGEYYGRVRITFDTYKCKGTEQIGDLIFVGYLSANQLALGGEVYSEALGAGVTLKLGDVGDDDRYMTATSFATAGMRDAKAIAGIGYRPVEKTPLFLTIGGAVPAADAVIKVAMYHVAD